MNIFSSNVFATLFQPVWPCFHYFWLHCSFRVDWAAVINSPHYFSSLTPQQYIFCSLNSLGHSCWVGISPPSRGVFQSCGLTILQVCMVIYLLAAEGKWRVWGDYTCFFKALVEMPYITSSASRWWEPSHMATLSCRISSEMESSYGLWEKRT